MGAALAGSGKALINTSGTALLATGASSPLGTETSTIDPSGARAPSENATLALA